MDEYLKKEVLIEDFKSCGANKDIVDAIIYRIDQHQPADVVEVRHGKWAWYPDMMDRQELLCTNCEEPIPYNEDGERIMTPYCPHCGARMDGEIK